MRNNLIAGAALAAGLLASGTAFAGEVSVYYLSDLTQGEGAFVKSFAHAKAVQAEINSNPKLAAQLRAQGVDIKQVIKARPNFDGSVSYYVK